jgi:DNA transformation protein
MTDLTKLPNIGSTLAAELHGIGVSSLPELVALGSVEATRRIARSRPGTCHSLLFALEGAIRGIRWHSIPKSERAALKDRFDALRDERERKG